MAPSPMQQGFSWIIDGKLAGMPRPGTAAPLEGDVDYLARQRIDLLVSLTEEPTPAPYLDAREIGHLHLPVRDFDAPTLDQLDRFVAAADTVIAASGRVGVHCAAGMGRTGTFLAAYLVHTGMTADEAMAAVRASRPGSIETPAQEAAIRAFAGSR